MNTQALAKAYALFYENLSVDSKKEEYSFFFDNYSKFQDPFQKVQGLNSIHNVFVDMYEKLYEPLFTIDEIICSEDVAYLRWKFSYALSSKSKQESFVGVSRVTFTQSGKIQSHIDYWDAAENVYEKIPLFGSLVRFLKRKIHA